MLQITAHRTAPIIICTTGFLKPIPETTPLERVAAGAAVASVVTALAAMIVEASAVVLVGGLLSAVVGPYAYYQQTQLTDIKALKETQEKIQMEVDRLTAENNRLAHNIDNLSETVQGLKDVEDALQIMTQTQGQTVQALAEQVEENKKILAKMQQNILQDLLSLIFSADANQDNIVNDHEVDDLLRRMDNLAGVQIDKERLRHAIVGKEVAAVMDVIQNLLNDDLPAEERIFVITDTN